MALINYSYQYQQYIAFLISILFHENQIVPDVVDYAPASIAQVQWGNGLLADFGNELTPLNVEHRPNVTWQFLPDKFYLVCMTDPDPPSRFNPTQREILHFLVGNVPGNDLYKGEVLAEYIPSSPEKDSGLHRYVYLVYEQPFKMTFDFEKRSDSQIQGRIGFRIRDFAKKHGIFHLVAGNFHVGQWDPLVDKTYRKLGVTKS